MRRKLADIFLVTIAVLFCCMVPVCIYAAVRVCASSQFGLNGLAVFCLILAFLFSGVVLWRVFARHVNRRHRDGKK